MTSSGGHLTARQLRWLQVWFILGLAANLPLMPFSVLLTREFWFPVVFTGWWVLLVAGLRRSKEYGYARAWLLIMGPFAEAGLMGLGIVAFPL